MKIAKASLVAALTLALAAITLACGRGRPYLYQTDDELFVVITEDDAWAAEALAQLP